MSEPLLIIVAAAVLGLALAWRAGHHARRRRVLAASRNGLGAGFMLGLAALAGALLLNLYTYQRLSYEQPVATVSIHEIAPKRFRVSLTQPGETAPRSFTLYGDQWQLDANVLKWRPWANLIGLNSVYRLNRLSGRYRDIEAARTSPRTAYSLIESDSGLDVSAFAGWLEQWLPVVDTYYGSAVFMPMVGGGRYRVALTQSGLVGRPVNATAKRGVSLHTPWKVSD